MLFNSLAFLFIFFPLVLLGTYLVSRKQRNLVLLIASILFMLMACGTSFRSLQGLIAGLVSADFWLLAGYIMINYLLGLGIRYQKKTSGKKGLLIAGLVLDGAPLLLYKVFGQVPLGLSFYTFQAVSYLADVYSGKARGEKSLTKFTVYMAMFPRILQGPIIRYGDIAKSLYQRKLTDRNLLQGLEEVRSDVSGPIFRPSARRVFPLRWPGWALLPIPCSCTSTLPATAAWPSAWAACWA